MLIVGFRLNFKTLFAYIQSGSQNQMIEFCLLIFIYARIYLGQSILALSVLARSLGVNIEQ